MSPNHALQCAPEWLQCAKRRLNCAKRWLKVAPAHRAAATKPQTLQPSNLKRALPFNTQDSALRTQDSTLRTQHRLS
jgi:hypothetical protein